MIYINITTFALISSLEKVNSIFEMCRLKNVAIYPNSFKFCAVKNNYEYLQQHCKKILKFTVKDFPKYKKLEYEKNKIKLDVDFFNNWKQLGVYPKFFIFKRLFLIKA